MEADPGGTKAVESGTSIGSEGTGSVEVSLLGTICESNVVEPAEGTSPHCPQPSAGDRSLLLPEVQHLFGSRKVNGGIKGASG